jgi:hydroxyacylglutathione hydrolase
VRLKMSSTSLSSDGFDGMSGACGGLRAGEILFCHRPPFCYDATMVRFQPLEDELGDVLEKAMKLAAIREDALAGRAGIDVNRIKDALDYRYDLSAKDIAALASALALNEVGLRALAEGRYPVPDVSGLPFRLHVLAMPYGVGVVNAYLLIAPGSQLGVLFDSGCCPRALERVWPGEIGGLAAHFVTHWDSDHSGGCRETMARFNLPCCYGPGPTRPGVRVMNDGGTIEVGGFRVESRSTPGHSREHLCYLVSTVKPPATRRILLSGDLFFSGSLGGGYFDTRAVLHHARKLWEELPGNTVVAPGHGPLTTIETERQFNPFSSGA